MAGVAAALQAASDVKEVVLAYTDLAGRGKTLFQDAELPPVFRNPEKPWPTRSTTHPEWTWQTLLLCIVQLFVRVPATMKSGLDAFLLQNATDRCVEAKVRCNQIRIQRVGGCSNEDSTINF